MPNDEPETITHTASEPHEHTIAVGGRCIGCGASASEPETLKGERELAAEILGYVNAQINKYAPTAPMTQQTDAPKCAYPLPRCGKPYAADGGDFSGVLTACENSLPCPNHPTDDAPKEQEYVEFRKWYDEFAKDLSHRSACFHAWLSRDSLIASLREQLAEREGEIAKMTSDFASLICRDAHCEYDCEGWREALKQLSDYGIKEPKHAAEEFARLESDNAALRSHLERIAHEVGWKQDLDALEYEVHSVMNELDMWRDEGPRLRREIAELKGEKAT